MIDLLVAFAGGLTGGASVLLGYRLWIRRRFPLRVIKRSFTLMTIGTAGTDIPAGAMVSLDENGKVVPSRQEERRP